MQSLWHKSINEHGATQPKRHSLVESCQFNGFLQLVNKLQHVKKLQITYHQFHQVVTSLLKPGLLQTCHLQSCYNLLKQLAASL